MIEEALHGNVSSGRNLFLLRDSALGRSHACTSIGFDRSILAHEVIDRNGLNINSKDDETKKRAIEPKKVRNIYINEGSKVGKETYLSLELIEQNGSSNKSVLFMLGLPKKRKTHAYG